MSFSLDKVVPWGRSFDEYQLMFALSERDLQKFILGCGDGPASFNAELTARGGNVVSVDPIYQCSADEIRCRINDTYDEVIAQTRANQQEFVWKSIANVDELGRVRMAAMETFLADYAVSPANYINALLPDLPFEDGRFDIALCSHFLFLYSEQFTAGFHLDSIRTMCRVAAEARIFPLLELGAVRSRHVDGVIETLQAQGYTCTIEKVPYEFQKGGNEMLRVKN